MQVFDFQLKPSDKFVFRIIDETNKISILREKQPPPVIKKSETRLFVATFFSTKERVEDTIKESLFPLVDVVLKDFPDANIFIARQNQGNQVELSIFGKKAWCSPTKRNHQMEQYIQRLLQLKAFW